MKNIYSQLEGANKIDVDDLTLDSLISLYKILDYLVYLFTLDRLIC